MQRVEAGVWVFTDTEVVRLNWLALVALPVVEKRDGGVADADRRLVEDLDRAARQSRNQIADRSRSSRSSSGTSGDNRRGAQPSSDSTAWPTTREAAETYGITDTYLRRLARRGDLEAQRDNRDRWTFNPDGLAAWAAGRTRN